MRYLIIVSTTLFLLMEILKGPVFCSNGFASIMNVGQARIGYKLASVRSPGSRPGSGYIPPTGTDRSRDPYSRPEYSTSPLPPNTFHPERYFENTKNFSWYGSESWKKWNKLEDKRANTEFLCTLGTVGLAGASYLLGGSQEQDAGIQRMEYRLAEIKLEKYRLNNPGEFEGSVFNDEELIFGKPGK